MLEHETAMLTFAHLARLSFEKRQAIGAHRFLLLAGAAACRSGWLDVAERCRDIIVTQNPQHFLSHSTSFADALRQPDNAGYFQQLERFCSFEQAEHLANRNGGPISITPGLTAGLTALSELRSMSTPSIAGTQSSRPPDRNS